MASEDSKCGDDCKLVEMLATKTSKEQAMENAIAAVQTGNISQRGAAKRFGVPHATLNRKIMMVNDVSQTGHYTTQNPKAARSKPTDKERQEWWDMYVNDGLTANAIHKKTGRNRLTISKEIKRRQEADAQSEPTLTLTPPPTEADSTKQQILRDWNGQLGDHHEKIIRREKPRNRRTEKFLEAMGLIKSQLKQTMEAASKDTREHGAGFLRMYMVVVEEQLRRENVPQIKPSLEALRKEARDIWKYADESLRLLQLQEGCSDLK